MCNGKITIKANGGGVEVGLGGEELSIWKLLREEKVGIECLMRGKKFAVRKTIEGLKGERSMHILLNAES